jgi:hypothetical protein
MAKDSVGRSKYWWLWPNFNSEKDARDGAKMGVLAAGLIAAVTGVVFLYRYNSDGDAYGLIGGLIVSIVWCFLGYGMFKMSRIAATAALFIFLADKLYTLVDQDKSLGIATILILYLINANRAIYWLKGKHQTEEPKVRNIITCQNCGVNQDLSDYSRENLVWLCSSCGKELPRQ